VYEPYDGKLSRTVLKGGKLEKAYLSNQRLKPYQYLYVYILSVEFINSMLLYIILYYLNK
jgi:hypothetical protein